MIELFIGAVLGTISSLIITHFYYRLSSRGLSKEIDRLRDKLAVLEGIMDNIEEDAVDLLNDVQRIYRVAVAGTPDDPDYPYK